jgi:3-oxoacyl-[acyl-carrier protein] reductase
MKFSEATAIITGGAAGFGRAFAERVLSGGGRVFITDVNAEQLAVTNKELTAKFGKDKVSWSHQNVVESDSFHRILDHATEYFGRPVNMLVNNAGIVGNLSFFNEDAPRQWEDVIAIDLTALMRGTQVGVQYMKEHLAGKEGLIVNLASVAGLNAAAFSPEYSAAKHGVIGFTRSCHPLKQQANIRVVGLAPAFSKTAMGIFARDHLPDLLAAMGGLIEVSAVVDAFQLAVEDETNAGRILRIVMGGRSYFRFAGDKALYPNAML